MAADLATVDRQRRDLVASVSHELRTPLTALVAVLENLDDGVTEPDPATIRVALGQAERLSDLVGDLLDLSRVDAGVVAARPRPTVPVAALVGDAVAEARGRAMRAVSLRRTRRATRPGRRRRPRRGCTSCWPTCSTTPPGTARPAAWCASGPGGVGDVVRLEVADEGAGIAPQDRERVFERFGTLQDPAGGGTGLGLAIARWVTDLHGGRIALVDPVPGESGARFRVDLPQTLDTAQRPVRGASPMTAPAQPHPATAGSRSPPRPMHRRRGHAARSSTPRSASLWPERGVPARRGVLLACLGIGVFAGLSLPVRRRRAGG